MSNVIDFQPAASEAPDLAELVKGVKTELAAATTLYEREAEVYKEAEKLNEAAEKHHQEAEKHQQEAGKLLKRAKALKPRGVTWPDFVRQHFDLSQQRADELIRISDGKTSLAEVRFKARERERKRQEKIKSNVSTDIGSEVDPMVPDTFDTLPAFQIADRPSSSGMLLTKIHECGHAVAQWFSVKEEDRATAVKRIWINKRAGGHATYSHASECSLVTSLAGMMAEAVALDADLLTTLLIYGSGGDVTSLRNHARENKLSIKQFDKDLKEARETLLGWFRQPGIWNALTTLADALPDQGHMDGKTAWETFALALTDYDAANGEAALRSLGEPSRQGKEKPPVLETGGQGNHDDRKEE